MILTICANPSIDCTIELDSLNVGMLNRIDNKTETYSGKALNAAIGIARLGTSVTATGFMFDNHKRMFEHCLDNEGVLHSFVYNEGNARVNYKIIDKKSMLTEINDRGEEVSPAKQEELLRKIKEISVGADVVIMSGSLPKGVPAEYYGKAIALLPEGVKIIIDAEKDNMLAALKTRPVYMVKPNVYELEGFIGRKIRTKADIIRGSKAFFEYGVTYVMVSMGAEGAILTDGKEHFYCKSANVAVNSTTGAGDSMVAASAVAFERGASAEEVLKCAVAAGTAAVTTSGTNLFYKDKYDEIYAKINPEKIAVE